MRGKNKIAIGLMAMVAATGIVHVSSSFASDTGHVVVEERIGHGGSIYQAKPDPAGACQMKVEVTERIGAGGPMYRSSPISGCQVAGDARSQGKVIQRIGAGGSTYSPSRPVS